MVCSATGYPALPVGIDVNHDSAEVRQVVEKLVADLLRDLVPVSHRQPPGTVMLTSAWRRCPIHAGHR